MKRESGPIKKSKSDHILSAMAYGSGFVFYKNEKAEYVWCNNNYAALIGLVSPDEIINKTDLELGWSKELLNKFVRDDERVLSIGVESNKVYELTFKDKNQDVMYVQIDKKPIYNNQNQIIGLLATGSDITNQQLQMMSQTQEYQLLENIFYHLPGLIYWKNKNSQYMGFNENVVKLSGLTKEQLLGKTDFELNWGGREAEAFRQDDQEIMRTGISKVTEYVVPIKLTDNNDMIVRTVKSPLYDEEGKSIGILAVAIDITAEKLAEEREKRAAVATAAAEAAMHVSKVKAENEEEMRKTVMILVGDIVHDLRTPIATIRTVAALLSTIFPGLWEVLEEAKELGSNKINLLNKKKLQYLLDNKPITALKSSVTMMDSFINTTLAELANAQKSQDTELTREDLTLCSSRRILENTLDAYPPIPKKIKIYQNTAYDFFLMGNSILIMKILFNLIRNAVEQITLTGEGDITITTEDAGDTNLIRIKDTGGGAAPEVVANFFKGYFTTKKNGTGIGLAYCKKTMQLFGGDLTCNSIFGESMEFILSFPKTDS